MTDAAIIELQRAVSGLDNPPAALVRAVDDVERKMRFYQQTVRKLLDEA